MIFCLLLCLTGCKTNSKYSLQQNDKENLETNPFEDNTEENINTRTLASISHGIKKTNIDTSGKMLPLEYNGDEMEIDYTITFQGQVPYFGFLVFIDGEPQPYKVDTTKSSYEYIHEFKLVNNEEKNIKFIFTPVTGKKGDLLEISIVSIFYPSFLPDMINTTSYGNYHQVLPSQYMIMFNQDAGKLDLSDSMETTYITDFKQSKERITPELLLKHNADESSVDTMVYSEFYINNVEMGIVNSVKLDTKDLLHITYKMFGHPNAKYKNIMYINQMPVTVNGKVFDTYLKKGEVSLLDLDIDISKLNDINSLYIISIPTNMYEYPNDVISVEKTSSITLYR